jgi:hypothetical protein
MQYQETKLDWSTGVHARWTAMNAAKYKQ